MKQQFVVPVVLALALMGTPVLAASQDQPNSRSFGERVKILFGFGEGRGESAEPATPSPAQPAAPEQQNPVQTFNDVEIELDSLGSEGLAGEN